MLAKQNSPWALQSFLVRMYVGTQIFPLRLSGRTDLLVLEEILLNGEYRHAPPTKGIIVDLGANIGVASLSLLAANPGARVIAVEADPDLIPQLKANTSGLPVTIVHAAIGHTCAPRTLYRNSKRAWASGLVQSGYDQLPTTVPGITFDELMRRHAIESIGLLKIDIEGAEWEAFVGGLPASVNAVVGELHVGEIHGMQNRDPDSLASEFAPGMNVMVSTTKGDCIVFSAVRDPATTPRETPRDG